MERFREIDRVIAAYSKGKISASKAREVVERVVFDDLNLKDLDPRELGDHTEIERIRWVMLPNEGLTVDQIAKRAELPPQRTAELCSRLARRGRATRTKHATYQRR